METLTVAIDGLTCEACAGLAERTISKIPGIQSASVDYKKRQAVVSFSPKSPPSKEGLAKAIEDAGFKAMFQTDP